MIYFLCISWLITTVAMALWWLYLGLKLSEASPGHDYRTMFIAESFVFITLIICGGVGLLITLRNLQKKTKSLAEFLSTISHEIKTSITNIRLQAGLITDGQNAQLERRSLTRLKDQCVRLETQLENSLLLAEEKNLAPFIQKIDLAEFLENQKENWTSLQLHTLNLNKISADTRALECIFNNAFQNAVRHSQDKNVYIRQFERDEYCVLEIETQGLGYMGPVKSLGTPFFHHGPSGGSGVGLYLTAKMMAQMGGRAEFLPEAQSFKTQLYFLNPA